MSVSNDLTADTPGDREGSTRAIVFDQLPKVDVAPGVIVEVGRVER